MNSDRATSVQLEIALGLNLQLNLNTLAIEATYVRSGAVAGACSEPADFPGKETLDAW